MLNSVALKFVNAIVFECIFSVLFYKIIFSVENFLYGTGRLAQLLSTLLVSAGGLGFDSQASHFRHSVANSSPLGHSVSIHTTLKVTPFDFAEILCKPSLSYLMNTCKV